MKKNIVYKAAAISFVLALASCASTSTKKETLQSLIMQGRYEDAKEMLKVQTDINERDADGNTALHVAARLNEADMTSFLIIKGADTEIKNNKGDTALHVAIKNNALDSAKVLAIVHGDIFAKDANEDTALELALAKGWYDAMITKQTGEIRDVNGQSIVHYFVRTRNERAIDCCIKQELDLSVKDSSGISPLALAFQSAQNPVAIRIAAKLIKAGAETVGGDYEYFEEAVKTRNVMLRFSDGQTPLHLATIQGHSGIVTYILNEKSSVRLTDILQAQDISGASPLHEAVRYGHVETAKVLLDAGAKVDALDSIGKSPFLLIIPADSQYKMYETLMEYNANVAQKDMYGDTVLHVATLSRTKAEVLSLLVNRGAPVNERNKQGITPLSLAIEKGYPEIAQFFAENGADIHAADQDGASPLTKALDSPSIDMLKTIVTPKNILLKDSAGNTALHIAIMRDSPYEYIKYLVDSGADVNARNSNGDSVLYLAVTKNRRDAGDLLLSKDADIFATNTQNYSPLRAALTEGGELQDWIITSKTLNARDGSGNTPLHYAAEWKLDDAITGLAQKGANVNAVNANGESALFSAVKADSPSTIGALVESGITTDFRSNLTRDHLGNTPLHCAVRWNALQAAQTLIGMGIDVNAQNLSGKTALSDTCRSDKREMAILLIQNGANVNSTDATGRSILIDAIQANNAPMVSLLLANGANPQIQQMSGRNAYHEAAIYGKVDIINMVRKAGGAPLSRDAKGDSPFSLVLDSSEEIIKAVLGSDTNIVDSDGNTPVHIAVSKKVPSKKLKMILNMGYPVSQRNGKGLTPLAEAVNKNAKGLAFILLERGADPFIATTDGDSALSNAFKNGNIEILDEIVKYNANKTDMQGDTILHYAARLATEPTIQHLLNLNLDRKVKNLSGETPAQMASRWERPAAAELLM